jgi:hypothetical protein
VRVFIVSILDEHSSRAAFPTIEIYYLTKQSIFNRANAIATTSALAIALTFAGFAGVILLAAAKECPEQGCVTEGRMTGGGRLNTDVIVTHRFELHCSRL